MGKKNKDVLLPTKCGAEVFNILPVKEVNGIVSNRKGPDKSKKGASSYE
jgi:hypothetical protein